MLLGHAVTLSIAVLHKKNTHTLITYFQKDCNNGSTNTVKYRSNTCEPWQNIHCVSHSVQATAFLFENSFVNKCLKYVSLTRKKL